MTGGEERDRRTELEAWAQGARVRSTTCAAQARRAAEAAAAIGEQVDRMIERVAEHNPQYAERLQAIIVAAAGQRAAIAECKRGYAAGRPDAQLLPGLPNGPGAAAGTELEDQPRKLVMARERDRSAGELQDEIVQRVFAAGLTLHDTAELAAEPEVRWRVEAAADDLDKLIQVLRDALFSPVDRPPGHQSRGGQMTQPHQPGD